MNARGLNNLRERSILFQEKIIPYLGSPHLDFGCGNGIGTMILALQRPDSSIVGYDIDPNKLSQARILLDGSSVSNLELTDSLEAIKGREFPTVTANFVYHEHLDLMKDLYSLIAPNGKVFIFDYDLKGISRRDFLKRFCCDNEKKVLIREGPENCYQKHTAKSLQDCIASVTEAGFRVKDTRSSGGYFALVGVKR